MVAPFWADADIRVRGNVSWEVLAAGDSERGDSYLEKVSEFIEDSQQDTFEGNWMMLVNYDQVPPYSIITLPIFVSPVYTYI